MVQLCFTSQSVSQSVQFLSNNIETNNYKITNYKLAEFLIKINCCVEGVGKTRVLRGENLSFLSTYNSLCVCAFVYVCACVSARICMCILERERRKNKWRKFMYH